MGRLLLVAAIVVLPGCDSPDVRAAKAAEQRYAIVKKSGSLAARCVASKAVSAAWLKALDESKYRLADVQAELDCSQALDPPDDSIEGAAAREADRLEAIADRQADRIEAETR